MRRDVFVYISGPMTAKHGTTVEENVAAGLRVFLDAMRRGIPAFCPHLSGAFPSAWADVPWDRWLAYDCAVIDRCSHVLLMPRWELSSGAIKERKYAIQQQIPIITSLDEIPSNESGQPCGCDPGLRKNGVVIGYVCEQHWDRL